MNNKQVIDDFGTAISEKITPSWADDWMAEFKCECGFYRTIDMNETPLCTCGRRYRLHWNVYIERLSGSPIIRPY